MKDCIFCQIVRGDVPCTRVYETEEILAFLDISPVAKGHTLIIPKKHVVNILDLPADTAPALQKALQKVGTGLIRGLKADGFNLGMNNFEAAGQLVMHAHYHLIPRFTGDGLKLWPQISYEDNSEMQKTAKNIQSGISLS
ncbi:MAG: HIT family protein [Desulfonatronovibrio sp.]